MPIEEIPDIGIGTWQNTDPAQCTESVATALDVGYRHVDTAQAYDNEAAVGEGIARSDVSREDVFLATKVWNRNLAYRDVLDSTEESLEKLGVDYVDLLYSHWPTRTYDPEDTMAAFAELRDEGTIQHIGASNFTPELLDQARDTLDQPIFAVQVEMHPLLHQEELVEYVRRHDMTLVAYSPLARGKVFDVPEVTEIAEKHDASPAQVSLAWLLSKDNVVTIPKATSEAHIRDNFAALDLELDDEDIRQIDAIDREERFVDPDFSPDW